MKGVLNEITDGIGMHPFGPTEFEQLTCAAMNGERPSISAE